MLLNKEDELTYVTPRGIVKIEAELARLQHEKRPEIVERLQDTRTGSDGIDNTEYLAVLDELAHVDGRIHELEYILHHVELIKPGEIDGIIRIGSTIVVQEEGAGLETYTLVGSAEANPSEGLISNQSPLGRALLNHTIGNDVEVQAPDGMLRFRIIAVK
jgi:transcription elongation factor GreA